MNIYGNWEKNIILENIEVNSSLNVPRFETTVA